MAAIVKANATLTNGGLSVIRRSFTTTDDGTMRYEVNYVCLATYAQKWTPFFKTKAQPPTPLPASMLQLQLTKTPELYDLQTETVNGLTYFRAVYSAGIATEVIITEESDIRNYSYSVVYTTGYTYTLSAFDGIGFGDTKKSFVASGEETVSYNFDYVSVTVRATSKNSDLPPIKGYVGQIFNVNGGSVPFGIREDTVETFSKTKSSRGEYTFSKSSTGILSGSSTIRGGFKSIN